MDLPHRQTEKININQQTKAADSARIDRQEAVLVLLPEKPRKGDWERVIYGDVLKQRYQRQRRNTGNSGRLITSLPNGKGTRIILQTIPDNMPTFELLTTARKVTTRLLSANPGTILVQLAGLDATAANKAVNGFITALLSACCDLPSYKQEPGKASRLKQIELYGLPEILDLEPVRAEVIGNHLARWLSAMPSNDLTPTIYRKHVEKLAKTEGWQLTFIDSKALKRKKAGAFLAVSQASPTADAGIIHLQYLPKKQTSDHRKLSLVGKGICFDTGGVNIKPARYMNGMHEDMQGSAVALGTLLALTRLNVDMQIDCWLALAENHVGPKAYKPSDVVTASNGTTIEIIHTDAEGRMVLADTLSLACKENPDLLIDYATLTGACIYSLSSRYSGVFSNRDALHPALIEAGRDSGERVWPFPLDKDYDDDLKSKIADTKQCTLDGEADHILAARFLNKFVNDDIDWIHLDLAASNRKGGLGHIATDTTGFGVRYTLNLLLKQDIMNNSPDQ